MQVVRLGKFETAETTLPSAFVSDILRLTYVNMTNNFCTTSSTKMHIGFRWPGNS
jgi:hypothetical protein